MKPDSNRLVAIDACVVALVSATICTAGDRLVFMTAFVPLILAARMAVLARIAPAEDVNLRAEVIFLAACTVLGAFNDWNSVCRKGIYDYTVPHFFAWSTIPIWMLLFWGMILRFVARLARWSVLEPAAEPADEIGLGGWKIRSGGVRVAALLALVFATRWTIYRLYENPILSWLPFLGAIIAYLILFRPTRHDLKLVGIFLLGGPIVEILYIQLGHLHRYHLGWIGGVPLWIVLWWMFIVVVWKDIAFRIEKGLRSRPGR